jgi:sulfur transfer protein SufE
VTQPINTLDKESEDLGLHVSLCSQRYHGITVRLDKIEAKMAAFEAILTENRRSLATVIITSSATIVTGLIGLIATILIKL